MACFSRWRRWLFLMVGCGFALLSSWGSYAQGKGDPRQLPWPAIVQQSRGSTVSFAMWGGSDLTNQFIDGWVAQQLKQQYNMTLRRVPLTDTVDAVNKVLGEVKAGRTKGSIDLIWINGENFRTMKQGNLLFGPFTQKLPSLAFYETAAVATDFGLPTDGYESPYTGSYYVMAADQAKVKTVPRSFAELLTWAKANPGRFAYVAPPAFDGSRFLLSAFYGVTGGYQQYLGASFQAPRWEQKSPQLWQYLTDLDPYLWRQGQTYPPTQTRLGELFANGEIWMMPMFLNQISEGLANGQFPPTTMAFTIPGAGLNDPSFTAIPINAPNPSGGMILADLLASPLGQLEKFKPTVWGDLPLLSIAKLSASQQQAFAQVEKDYGIPLKTLTQGTAPVVNAEYTVQLEKNWQQRFGS